MAKAGKARAGKAGKAEKQADEPIGKAHLARAKKLAHDLDDIYEALHYREFKILLKAAAFSEMIEAEVRDYWKLVRRIAGELLISVRRGEQEKEPHYRDIVFLDTPEFDLYRNGYMLRVRRPYVGAKPAKTYELTLKLRGPDIGRTSQADMNPDPAYAGRVKFKEEILLVSSELGGMRSIFSHTCQLGEQGEPIGTTFGDFTRIFPALAALGPKPTTPIAPASPVPVQEVLFDLGVFGFRGAKTAKVNMAVWRDPHTEKIMIGEFAYETHFKHYGRLNPIPKLRSERLYRLLQRETGSWVELGTTKTAMYYALSGKSLAHAE